MSCLNCNRETECNQVFCEICLQEMEAFPVRKGTPIVIPAQPSPAPVKKTPRRVSAEDQLLASTRLTRRMAFLLLIMSVLLAVAAGALLYLTWPEDISFLPWL